MNRLSAAIAFISTTECEVIKKWERYLHILREELVIGGGNIGYHESQIASRVTGDQNTIRILIIFWAVRERQFLAYIIQSWFQSHEFPLVLWKWNMVFVTCQKTIMVIIAQSIVFYIDLQTRYAWINNPDAVL